jgi:hypothetical protein
VLGCVRAALVTSGDADALAAATFFSGDHNVVAFVAAESAWPD